MSVPDALAAFTPNPLNPRQPWQPDQREAFTQSLRRFGDLGGIVRNLTTGQLVGGHKRVEVFRAAPDVQIVKTDQDADGQGTVAHGYVVVEGTRFAYREVRWSPAVETAANLAANRWGAEWDWQLVAGSLHTIGDTDLLALTGFPADELTNLLAADWSPEAPGTMPTDEMHAHVVRLTEEAYALVQQAKAHLQGVGSEVNKEAWTDSRVIEVACARVVA